MKLISVVSPCYNEEGNIEILVDRVRELFANLPQIPFTSTSHRQPFDGSHGGEFAALI